MKEVARSELLYAVEVVFFAVVGTLHGCGIGSEMLKRIEAWSTLKAAPRLIILSAEGEWTSKGRKNWWLRRLESQAFTAADDCHGVSMVAFRLVGTS